MYRTSFAFAALAASMESQAEPAPIKSFKHAYGLEAIDQADLQSQLHAVQEAIAHEERCLQWGMNLKDSMENLSGPMTPFQAQMAVFIAKKAGVTLAHERHGFGMEAYSGPRGRTLLRASTEGFKEWFKEFLAKLVKLWKRFAAWFKSFFDRRFIELRSIRTALGSSLQRSQMHGGDRDAVRGVFADTEGRTDVSGTVRRTEEVLDSLTSAGYMAGVQGYAQHAMSTAKRFLEAEGNTWRKFAAEVTQVKIPVPEGFVKGKQQRAEMTWQSQRIANRAVIELTVGEGENVQGHRGAGEYTDALNASTVSMSALAPPPVSYKNMDFKLYTDSAEYKGIVQLINKAIASESRVRPFLKSTDDVLREVEAMKDLADRSEGTDQAASHIAAKLLSSVRQSDNVAAKMLDTILDAVIQVGRGGTHLAATTIS